MENQEPQPKKRGRKPGVPNSGIEVKPRQHLRYVKMTNQTKSLIDKYTHYIEAAEWNVSMCCTGSEMESLSKIILNRCKEFLKDLNSIIETL